MDEKHESIADWVNNMQQNAELPVDILHVVGFLLKHGWLELEDDQLISTDASNICCFHNQLSGIAELHIMESGYWTLSSAVIEALGA